MAGLVADDLSASNATVPIFNGNANSEVVQSDFSSSKNSVTTDCVSHQTAQDVTFAKVTTTVKRIQTKNGAGRNFIELQDMMRHILKVPSR